jgi:hypothetical protein
MGYTLSIGNAIPQHSKDYGELTARWTVEGAQSDDAPTFPHDDMTGNGNHRSPSYSGWSEFAKETGLERLFFDKSDGLLERHPGCKILTQAHHTEVLAALQRRQKISTKPPGFEGWNGEDRDKHDAQLARLMWLEWWMRWALANCETPAFQNT